MAKGLVPLERRAPEHTSPEEESALLDRVFFALSDPSRRAILERLDKGSWLVSELAAPFDISLQAISRHIQVLVAAGLVQQERTGRISRCRLDAGPMFAAAVWINRYSRYWTAQFDALVGWLDLLDQRRDDKVPKSHSPTRKPKGKHS
jgi:DNA-binding transcriptional ArsR family regulator